ncbi:hypothetical protein [Bacillus phage BvP]
MSRGETKYFKNYRDFLEDFKDTHTVNVSISVWTYRSKRMRFTIPLKNLGNNFDNDLNFTYKDKDFTFETIEGKQHKFHYADLKTVKVDCVECTQIAVLPLDYINVKGITSTECKGKDD